MIPLIDPLESVFSQIGENISSNKKDFPLELFTDERFEKDGIAFKTDLTHTEHVLVSSQTSVNHIIKAKFKEFGLDVDLYGDFLLEFKRHKVSLDRKSREEFTRSISGGIQDTDIQRMSNIKNLTESRQ